MAVGRPGATYANAPFVGGGFQPMGIGYGPGLGFDIATGMMIGHVLRAGHHHRVTQQLHAPQHQHPAIDAAATAPDN